MIDKDDQNQNMGNRPNQQSYQDPNNEYGLPEAEYSPIEREHREVPIEPAAYDPSFKQKEEQPPQKNSSWPMWVALGVILLLAGVFVFYLFLGDSGESEKVATKPAEGTNTFIVEEETPLPEPDDSDWEAPSEPEVREGSVSTISSKTGKYYMIVGSFIDGDLAQDYAQKLAKNGLTAKIIEPAGTRKFYRLSVKDADGINDLTAELDSMRQKFGENVWIVKY